MKKQLSRSRDKLLFTPGPLTTSQGVKQAMLTDMGSRDKPFLEIVQEVQTKLLMLAGIESRDFSAVFMQGSGTFCMESVISSVLPREKAKLLVIENGEYGRRIAQIATTAQIPCSLHSCPENQKPDPNAIGRKLSDKDITHIAMVHCETTTGMINPISDVGLLAKNHGQIFIVDAMSSFGAVPIDIVASNIHYLISSANKCIEGVPGFSFVLCHRDSLMQTQGFARSLSLDLFSQAKNFERFGQFRFTPPTHVILAFHQALIELEAEGGIEARKKRYRENYETLVSGMDKLGFERYLAPEDEGYIITSFLCPGGKDFDFEGFYTQLSDKGFLIYPGKVSDAYSFRIGNIGRIFKEDVKALLLAIGEILPGKLLSKGRE